MPIFFSRHSAHPFERPLLLPRVVFLSPEVLLRFRVRSGETLLPRCSIFATVTAPSFLETNKPDSYPLDEWQRMVLSETRGLWLSSIVRGGIG